MQSTIDITGFEPIIEPTPVSFWPPAPGWYVVGALLLLIIFFVLHIVAKRYNKNKYRRQALQELKSLVAKSKTMTRNQLISSLNTLMKRTALEGYPRETVASLSGKEWIYFLTTSNPKADFTNKAALLLSNSVYDKSRLENTRTQDWQELIRLCKMWIIHHKT